MTTASTGPSVTTRGVNPRAGARSVTARPSSARRSGDAVGADSSKMVRRMSLMVASMSSTAVEMRCAASGRTARRAAFSRVSPIANSRWITRSCRSRPIRSRSSKTASRLRSSRACATCIASAAWSAYASTSRTSVSRKARSEAAAQPMASTPESVSVVRSGTRSNEPSGPASSCGRPGSACDLLQRDGASAAEHVRQR